MLAEESHFWFRARNRLIGAAVSRYLPPTGSMLEVGCGNGNVLRALEARFPEAHLTGIERECAGARLARQRCRSPIIHGDASGVEDVFDVVAAFDVMEHVEDDAAFMRILAQRVADDGHVILTVPAHRRLYSYWDIASGHRRRYSRSRLEAVTAAAGLRIDMITPIFLALLPAIWARTRAVAVGQSPEAVIEDDLRAPGPVVNRLAALALGWESLVVGRGWTLPAGSSFLLVASARSGAGQRPLSA